MRRDIGKDVKGMQKITVRDVLDATGGSLICGGNAQITAVTTDSRKVEAGALFVPLAGENVDGHDYIEKALEEGASVSLTAKDIAPVAGKTIIRVEDTKKALAQIAHKYKELHNVPTVGVTGSVGKTTTKDMLSSVLATSYCTLKTQGNFNNEIGLPLTVFGLQPEHEMAVLEMGMSAMGEIHDLVEIARPEVAVITNIGMSHIENLGSQEGIFQAKMEICDFFGPENLLVVNGDDPFLRQAKEIDRFGVITFGMNTADCDVRAENIENLGIDGSRFTVCLDGAEHTVYIPTAGVHNIYNALAAICVGRHFGIPMEKIVQGIAQFSLTGMRMAIERAGDITIINDCYNASPDSIRASLKVLASTKASRKIAVLGDMLEMGRFSKTAHYELGGEVWKSGADMLFTAGESAEHIAIGARDAGLENVISYKTTAELAEHIGDYLKDGDMVLVKASRGMHFEQICDRIKQKEAHTDVC